MKEPVTDSVFSKGLGRGACKKACGSLFLALGCDGVRF